MWMLSFFSMYEYNINFYILVLAGRQTDFTLLVLKADSGELVAFTQAIVDEVFFFYLPMKRSRVFISRGGLSVSKKKRVNKVLY